jgi:hypothetical protein
VEEWKNRMHDDVSDDGAYGGGGAGTAGWDGLVSQLMVSWKYSCTAQGWRTAFVGLG